MAFLTEVVVNSLLFSSFEVGFHMPLSSFGRGSSKEIWFQRAISLSFSGLHGFKFHFLSEEIHISFTELFLAWERAYSFGKAVARGPFELHLLCHKETIYPLFISHEMFVSNQSRPFTMLLQGALAVLNLPNVGIFPRRDSLYLSDMIFLQRAFGSLWNLLNHFLSREKFVSQSFDTPSPPLAFGVVILAQLIKWEPFVVLDPFHKKFPIFFNFFCGQQMGLGIQTAGRLAGYIKWS